MAANLVGQLVRHASNKGTLVVNIAHFPFAHSHTHALSLSLSRSIAVTTHIHPSGLVPPDEGE